MYFRAASLFIFCALSTVNAWPNSRGKNEAPVDGRVGGDGDHGHYGFDDSVAPHPNHGGPNNDTPPFPKHVDASTPMLKQMEEPTEEDAAEEDATRDATEEDAAEEDATEEDLPSEEEDLKAKEEKSQKLAGVLDDLSATLDIDEKSMAENKDADEKVEELIDLLGIKSGQIKSELYTSLNLLSQDDQGDETESPPSLEPKGGDQGDETESLPSLEPKGDATDEEKEIDGMVKSLGQDFPSEEETEEGDLVNNEEEGDTSEEELEIERAENLIAEGKSEMARLRNKLGLSGGTDSPPEDGSDGDESDIENEIIKAKKMVNADMKVLENDAEENEQEELGLVEPDESLPTDESLSGTVDDLLNVLKQEKESLEEMDEGDESDGAMNPSDEDLMDKAVNELRQEMKSERETDRNSLRGRGNDQGDEDEDY
jgi:hypothetical protein